MNRRFFITGALASFGATQAIANAPMTSLRPRSRDDDFLRQIQPEASVLVDQAKLGGRVGCSVWDLSSGSILEETNAHIPLPPASVAKVMTAAYALDFLGPDYRFETKILATGPIVDGRLEGDLLLIGGADPTLDTNALAAMADQLKQSGVAEVSGDFLIWDGALPLISTIDAGQPAHVGYSPAISGLNLNYNRVHFNWARDAGDYSISMEARTDRFRPAVRMARMRVEARALPVYTYQDQNGRDEWTVARSALGNGGARWLPVRKPSLYAAEVFQSLAKAQGISLGAPRFIDNVPAGETLVLHQSKPLRVVLRDMLKWSTNLTAEVVGLLASQSRTEDEVTSLAQSAEAMSEWASKKFGLTSMAFVDHSGLGEKSRISAHDMAKALFQLRKTKGVKPLLKGFPMRDSKRRIIEDHPLSVHAKTGTLNFVSGLGGFLDLPDGRELVFAIFTANMDKRAGLSLQEKERPPGGKEWNHRSKALQQKLLERWGVVYAL